MKGHTDSGMRETFAFGIPNRSLEFRESGIPVTIGVPLTKTQESSTWNREFTFWNPESETVLDSLT